MTLAWPLVVLYFYQNLLNYVTCLSTLFILTSQALSTHSRRPCGQLEARLLKAFKVGWTIWFVKNGIYSFLLQQRFGYWLFFTRNSICNRVMWWSKKCTYFGGSRIGPIDKLSCIPWFWIDCWLCRAGNISGHTMYLVIYLCTLYVPCVPLYLSTLI